MSVLIDQNTLDLISHSEEQTRRFGAYLAPLLKAGDVICLRGELGVGKTRFVQGIAQGLQVEGPVRSPSFTLVWEYTSPAGLKLFHIDLYRLGDAVAESLAIGIEEYLYGDGVCVIEWSERAEPILPADRLTVEMRFIDDYKRGILLRAGGERSRELLTAYRSVVTGHAPASSAPAGRS
jgi:tRNA threonylcarbamoyladenosine biosynthesis protein TsaE